MNTIITYDINNLTEVSVFDGTEFTAPASVLDIQGVRLLFETVYSVEQAEVVTSCEAWYEYEVLSGTAIANGVSYATGSTMLFANDTTPTGTYTMQKTGRYGQYVSTELPYEGNGWAFTPSQTGRTAMPNGQFYDEIFTLTYEFYDEIFEAGDTLDAGVYLVVNTTDADSSVLVGGTKTIYVGEVYTSAGSETFTSTSAGTYMVKFAESSQYSFATLYNSFQVYKGYLAAKAVATSPDYPLDSNLLAVAALFASPQVANSVDSGIDLTGLQVNIDRILSYYLEQL